MKLINAIKNVIQKNLKTIIFFTILLCIFSVLFAWLWSCINPEPYYVKGYDKEEIHERPATQAEIDLWTKKEEPKPVAPAIKVSKGGCLTISSGVFWFNGLKETWYGPSAGRHYRTDEWTPDPNDEYFYKDSAGYYVIACSDAICPMGGIIQTSKGMAIRCDTCPTPGVIDFYVDDITLAQLGII